MLLNLIFLPYSSNSFYEKANLQDVDLLMDTFCLGLEKSDRLPGTKLFNVCPNINSCNV